MLKDIKAKLLQHFLPQESATTAPKTNTCANTILVRNTPAPREIFHSNHPETNRSAKPQAHLPASLKSAHNPDCGTTQRSTPTPAPVMPLTSKASQQTDHKSENMQLIGHGSRGKVYRQGETVTKVISLNTSEIGSQLQHEVKMCNTYWLQENGSSPATLRGNQITMPFIDGTSPDRSETRNAVQDLYDRGLMMGDPKPSNFVKTQHGRIVPVDFGLVFSRDNIQSMAKQVKIEIVHDYINGGYQCVPSALTSEYTTHLRELDESLGKESPARKMQVKKLARVGLLNIV